MIWYPCTDARPMQWQALMDMSFLAAAMATKEVGADAPHGLGGHTLFSVPGGLAALGGDAAEAADGGPLPEQQGPAQLPVVLRALARVVAAAPVAAPGTMTADVATDVLTLVNDCLQLVVQPMLTDGNGCLVAACCASLAQVAAAVVAVAHDALGSAPVAEAAADALLQLLSFIAPREGRGACLDALPAVRCSSWWCLNSR